MQGSTWSSGRPLLEVAELRAVPSNVAHVAALETAAVLGLPLVLLRVLVLVVLLLLHSAQKQSRGATESGSVRFYRPYIQQSNQARFFFHTLQSEQTRTLFPG